MSLPAKDNFNRASLGTDWSVNTGSVVILSSVAVGPNNAAGEGGAGWNVDVFSKDQYAKLDGTATLGANTVGPAVRVAVDGTTDSYYGLYWSSAASQLFKMVTGTWTQFGSNGPSVANGDVIRLEVVGSKIAGYKNNVLMSTPGVQTDTALTSGRAGVSTWSGTGTTTGDNWEGGDMITKKGLKIYQAVKRASTY